MEVAESSLRVRRSRIGRPQKNNKNGRYQLNPNCPDRDVPVYSPIMSHDKLRDENAEPNEKESRQDRVGRQTHVASLASRSVQG